MAQSQSVYAVTSIVLWFTSLVCMQCQPVESHLLAQVQPAVHFEHEVADEQSSAAATANRSERHMQRSISLICALRRRARRGRRLS